MAETLSARLRRLSSFSARDGSLESFLAIVDAIDHPARDRTVVLVGAVYVEDGLRRALTAMFSRNVNAEKLKALFEGPNGPLLGSFSARTKIAQALGVIDSDMVDDIDIIRLIRNAFAHMTAQISFDTPEIRSAVASLKVLQDPLHIHRYDGIGGAEEHHRFTLAAGILANRLLEAAAKIYQRQVDELERKLATSPETQSLPSPSEE